MQPEKSAPAPSSLMMAEAAASGDATSLSTCRLRPLPALLPRPLLVVTIAMLPSLPAPAEAAATLVHIRDDRLPLSARSARHDALRAGV